MGAMFCAIENRYFVQSGSLDAIRGKKLFGSFQLFKNVEKVENP